MLYGSSLALRPAEDEVASWSQTFGWTFSDTDFQILPGESYFVKVRDGPSSWVFTP